MDLPTPADLRERRTELELTQSDLAAKAEVSQPLIARIEGGDVDPRLSTLRRIVNALEAAQSGVVRARDVMNDEVVSVEPDDAVSTASERMLQRGYSQLPVIREGSTPEGIISNKDIRQAKEDSAVDIAELPISEAMRESVATVEPDATLDEIEQALDHHDAVVVKSAGEIVGIITEADVVASFA